MTAPLPTDRRAVPTVAIIGNDAVLAAAPATPVQLAHACLQCGFSVAVPASWGDELVAAEAVRRLATREKGPAVMCVCPYVRSRLLAPGPDLAPFLLSLLPPPVAVARYLRAAYGEHGIQITYIGGCPGADDPSIDEHLTPDAFFAEIAERGIALSEQPLVFDSIVPPDRRRWCSLPGGVPSADALWNETDMRTLVEIDSDDPSTDLAQHIITAEHVLLDLAPSLGCACSGAIPALPSRSARVAVTALEPPRAPAPVIDPAAMVSLDAPLRATLEAAEELSSRDRDAHADASSRGPASESGTAPPASAVATTSAAGSAHPSREAVAVITQPAQARLEGPADVTVERGSVPTPEAVAQLFDQYLPHAVLADPNDEAPSGEVSPPEQRRDQAELAQTHPAEGAMEVSVDAVIAQTADGEADVPDDASELTPLDVISVGEPSSVRRRTPQAGRPIAGIPRATSGDGRLLPRAYVAKRRSPPAGMPVVAAAAHRAADPRDTGAAPANGRAPHVATETHEAPAAGQIVAASHTPPAAPASPPSAAHKVDAEVSVRRTMESGGTRGVLVLLLVAALVILGVFVLLMLRR